MKCPTCIRLETERDQLREALRPFTADWIGEYADDAARVGAQMISPPLDLAVWHRACAALDGEA